LDGNEAKEGERGQSTRIGKQRTNTRLGKRKKEDIRGEVNGDRLSLQQGLNQRIGVGKGKTSLGKVHAEKKNKGTMEGKSGEAEERGEHSNRTAR